MQRWDPTLADNRSFGDQILRLVQDLHRPNSINIVPDYLRDAIRHFSRHPFFFTEVDNVIVRAWESAVQVTPGYTIRDTASDTNFYILVALTGGLTGATKPAFTPNLFVPSNTAGIVFTPGQTGTTVEGNITWATIQAWPNTNAPASTFWTELSTIPATNQYTAPIDYSAPTLVEVTAANLRIPLAKDDYANLRGKDTIRPAPITLWPAEYAWYQQQLYFWPYPNAFYPITLSYYTAPFPPVQMTDSNFWTTTAEAMVRAYAGYLINLKVYHDDEAAVDFLKDSNTEFNDFYSKYNEQNAGPIPAVSW